MIVNERIVSYIHSLEKSNSEIMDEIEAYAHENDVPIIRKEMESFLKVLIEMKKPKKILELGKERSPKGFFYPIVTDESKCISCGICSTICPEGAIEIPGKEEA